MNTYLKGIIEDSETTAGTKINLVANLGLSY